MKKLYKCLSLTLAVMLLASAGLLAQERTVTGTVTDENGSPMPGINILVKGTTKGTATDADGKYSLAVPGNDAILVFSFVGYAPKEEAVGSRTSVSVQMSADVTTLQEMVVTGYAIQEKKDITGAVGVVNMTQLTSVPAPNPEAQLQGRVAGVTVMSNGIPGGGSIVRIRGFSSFGSSAPLYVIDGTPTYDITTLNSNDIESMTVLKDAASASIYGARASNGVVVVTTRKGSSDSKMHVNYDMYYGVQDPGKGFTNLLDPQGQANLEWLAKKNDGAPLSSGMYGSGASPVLPDYILPSGVFEGNPLVNPALYNHSSNPDTYYQITKANKAGTDWFKEVTQKAPIQNHSLSVTGGNTDAKYGLSFNYFDQKGIIIDTYSKRFGVRANSEFNIKNRIRIGENIALTYRANSQGAGAARGQAGSAFNNQQEGNAIAQSYRIQRIVPVYDIRGNFAGTKGVDLGNGSNPVAIQERSKDNIAHDVRVLGNVYAEVDIIKNLTARTSFGADIQDGYSTQFTALNLEVAEPIPTNNYNEFAFYNQNWVWTNMLTYKKKFGDHNLTVFGGTEAVKTGIGRNMTAQRNSYFVEDPNYISLNQGASAQANNGQPNTPTTLYSLFARADYSFKDKYYLGGTIRRDGSSKFGPENRYGIFPAVTAGWRISGESFMSSVSAITDFKLRAGWGVMGNQNPVSPTNSFAQFGGGVNQSYYDINGANSGSVQGFRQTAYGNLGTKWESNTTTNVGFDAAFLDGKLTASFDWYSKVTKGLLFNPEFPATYGVVATPALNIGQMTNKGVDLQIGYRTNVGSDWRLDLSGTFTTYKNKIDKIAPGYQFFDSNSGEENRLGERFVRNQVGHSISSFYGYKVIGIIQPSDTAAYSKEEQAAGQQAGAFKFEDTNGDGKITADDKQFIGSAVPKFTYGLNVTVGYKGFDLTVFLYGVQGADIMNFTKWWTDFPSSFRGAKSSEALNNSWTPERTDATVPMASYTRSNIFTNKSSNSYYLEDGSYLRARNIQLAYTLPTSLSQKAGLQKVRIYVQGANLFTITKYSGLNPELTGSDSNFNVDVGNYPTPKQYLVGLNLSL